MFRETTSADRALMTALEHLAVDAEAAGIGGCAKLLRSNASGVEAMCTYLIGTVESRTYHTSAIYGNLRHRDMSGLDASQRRLCVDLYRRAREAVVTYCLAEGYVLDAVDVDALPEAA